MTRKTVDFKWLADALAARPQTPELERNGLKVAHSIVKAGDATPVISMRNALLQGQRPTSVRFEHDFVIRTLSQDDHGVWMTDSPQEVWQMRDALSATGDFSVLVGGMGLGVYPHLAARESDWVTVVEINGGIVDLVGPYIDRNIDTVVADLFDYLENLRRGRHDFALFDIWQATGESTWKEYIVPLRRASRGKIPLVMCWCEEEMIGQLRNALCNAATADETISFDGYNSYYEVFRRVAQSTGAAAPSWGRGNNAPDRFLKTIEAATQPAFKRLFNLYVKPGTDAWERKFGSLWDELVGPREVAA